MQVWGVKVRLRLTGISYGIFNREMPSVSEHLTLCETGPPVWGKASPVNRTFCILFLMPFYARSRSHTVCDSFLFQYLVTVMMARERESQTMSGCHVTKVFSTTFRFRPHDSRWTPTVTPAEICTHSFSACLRLMGLSQTPHDSWAWPPKQHTNTRFE